MGESIAIAVTASLLTAFFIRFIDAAGDVRSDDFKIAVVNEDVRRWVRDSDRRRTSELEGLRNDLVVRGMAKSGAAIAGPKRRSEMLREKWRNECSRAIREYRQVALKEGWLHWLLRRLIGNAAAPLVLPADVMEMLEEWRAPIKRARAGVPEEVPLEDPAWKEGEEDIEDFESTGMLEFKDAA